MMLLTIQVVHTAITAMIYACIFYILYCGAAWKASRLLPVAIAVVLFEGSVVACTGWICPFRTYVDRLTGDPRTPDILLPDCIAEWLIEVGAVLFLTGIILNIFRRKIIAQPSPSPYGSPAAGSPSGEA